MENMEEQSTVVRFAASPSYTTMALLVVKCKHPEYCNEEGTVVVVTDSGEEKADFILSFSAYAKLAKPLMVAKLVAQGEVEIECQRVPCKYATGAHLMASS
ncbi:hypothetical protein K7X08_032218 [Anisodus acutangulus]|uniref:Expansin-like EG45 domain-containing protein n=1 Tax=Anisodus acutangulus TaxID=402998 RepID=A0A9Q1MC34_9SOLA|nr:hypothetical protein K7X08_032218 [Anisodus acutangulus]